MNWLKIHCYKQIMYLNDDEYAWSKDYLIWRGIHPNRSFLCVYLAGMDLVTFFKYKTYFGSSLCVIRG